MAERSGFTSLGFSKAGFSCCGRWQYCDMGRKKCYYEGTDDEVRRYCHAYIRHTKSNVEKSSAAVQLPFVKDNGGQLSLF
jgi:hypothetical protein